MRVLVYGAGVIGCELAHMLVRAGNDVVLLARGAWRETIEANGLVIRHYAQLRTTVDHVATIDGLLPDDEYDLIFVVMQYGQVEAVFPDIAANRSRHVVLVGNNMEADEAADMLPEKQLAFGFQPTAGRRERGKVISIHAGVGMTVGGLHAPLAEPFRQHIRAAFSGVRYRLTWEDDMDVWLKCHMAFILPVAYICYATGFHLPRSTRRQRDRAIDAAIEGYAALRKLGYPIRPAGSDDVMIRNRGKIQAMLWIMAKTPIGRLAASDHCRNAGVEMVALDGAFEDLRREAGIPMPNWDALRREGQPHE